MNKGVIKSLKDVQALCERADKAQQEGDLPQARICMAAVLQRLQGFESWGTRKEREQALEEAG